MKENTKMMYINLKHLVIDNQKQIGLQFYPNKIIQALIKELPQIKWSTNYNMAFLPNTKKHLNLIFKTFKGVCWINTKYFFVNRPINTSNKALDLTLQREKQKQKQKNWRTCPDSFLQKLEIRRYAPNTATGHLY